MDSPTLIVTAYSKAPQNTTMYENNKFMGIVLEINKETHVIVNAEATLITQVAKDYFKRLLVGVNFKEDITPVLESIKENYLAPSQNSMIVALKVAHQRYLDNCM